MPKILKIARFAVGKAAERARLAKRPKRQAEPRETPRSLEPAAPPQHPLAPSDHALAEAAAGGGPMWGLILQRHHARLGPVVAEREAYAIRHGDLADRLALLDAELDALTVEPAATPEPPTPAPVPTVLHHVSRVLPFTHGDHRHG